MLCDTTCGLHWRSVFCDLAQRSGGLPIGSIAVSLGLSMGRRHVKSEVIVTDKQLPSEVILAIEKGRKIEAIKILREKTGIGLANAKVLVDRAWRTHGPQKPAISAMNDESALPKLAKSAILALALFGFYFVFLKY